MRIGTVLRDLHEDETELARALVRVADAHRADHEVFHLGHDLAVWSRRHISEIAHVATQFDQALDVTSSDPAGVPAPTEIIGAARRWLSERAGQTPPTELALVRDLRELYLRASGVLIDWEMVGQAAQVISHAELHELAVRCQAEAKRQATWAHAKVKECSTQALVV